MIDFLIKSGICLVAFLGFYHLVLEKEKMHRFNRFYLLLAIAVSLILPFITFEIIKVVPITNEIIPMPQMQVVFEKAPEKIDYTPIVLWGLYGLVTMVLVLRFGKNIQKLISKAASNPTVNYKNARLVLVNEKTLPHTFLNNIFINFEDYNNRNIEDELYTHELVHVTQKHTLDILFIEFLKTVFWFNPIFILYKRAIQLNHEFLADEKVVESCNDVPFYQSLLLQKGNGNQPIYLASNLNYLVTKKRLIMMTKSTSKRLAFLKKVAIVPILAGLIYFFCIEVVAQEKATPLPNQKPIAETDKDKIRDSYYSGVRVILKDKRNGTEINKMYEELTLEQKRSYMEWVPDMKIEKEVPQALFTRLSTKNNAVWINNKIASKEDIRKYKRTDFTYYTYSFVHKNARSKRFPQEYQYTLYTKDFFDKNLKNSHLHFFNDTIKMVFSDWKKADKVNKLLNTPKADTVVWYNNDQKNREYNISINKDKATTAEPTAEETDKGPVFPGGNSKFYEFLAKNYNIPEEARKNKIKGNLYVAFFVEEDGSLSDIKIAKDLQFGTGEEALRVLKNCPKWIPGEVNGKKTRMGMTLPINIQAE